MTAATNVTAKTEQQLHKKQDKKKNNKKTQQQLLENEGHANMQPYQRQRMHALLFILLGGVHCTHSPPQMAADTHTPQQFLHHLLSSDKEAPLVHLQPYANMYLHSLPYKTHPSTSTGEGNQMHSQTCRKTLRDYTHIPPKTHQCTNSQVLVFTHTQLCRHRTTQPSKAQTYTNTAHMNSPKLEMKENDPLPSCCSYRFRWRPGKGCDRHSELLFLPILPGTSNALHGIASLQHRDNPQCKVCPSYQRTGCGGATSLTHSNHYSCDQDWFGAEENRNNLLRELSGTHTLTILTTYWFFSPHIFSFHTHHACLHSPTEATIQLLLFFPCIDFYIFPLVC